MSKKGRTTSDRTEVIKSYAKKLLKDQTIKDIVIANEARKMITDQGWTDCKEDSIRRILSMQLHKEAGTSGVKLEAKPEEVVHLEHKTRKLNINKRAVDKKLRAAYDRITELENQLDTVIKIKEQDDGRIIVPKPDKNLKHPAIPCVLWSDWHIEETVNPRTINHVNEYNVAIAEQRSFTLFENTVKMINKEKHYSDITSIFVWLGGDFITGYIHEELEEENELSPLEAVRVAKKLIIGGIEYLAKETGIPNIIVRCNWGNHGRVQKKKRVATSYKNSYEFHMYHEIKDYFAGTSVKVLLDESRESYTRLFDKYDIRTWHGDNIRYSGGIGGVTVPLRKFIMRQDQNRKADYNLIGHFHQCWQVTENCQMNGSMIGYNAYAQELGCRMEPPMQALQMLSYKHGFYAPSMPIHCF